MSEKNYIEELCFVLSVFINEIRKQCAAIRAYVIVFGDDKSSNVFINTENDCIWHELLTEFARIFDPVKTGSNENCSLARLQSVCLNSPQFFPDGKNDTLINNLENILKKYNELPIKKSRNKQLAHHDMRQVFGSKPIEISFDDLENLMVAIDETLKAIYARVLWTVEISFPEYTSCVKEYVNALSEIFDMRK